MTSPEAEPERQDDVRVLERLIEVALDRRGVRGGGGDGLGDGAERRISALEKAQGDIADKLGKLLDRTAASDARLASIEAKLDAKASTTEVAKALASIETRLEKTFTSIEAKLDTKASTTEVAKALASIETRLEKTLSSIEAKLDSKASAADVATIEAKLDSKATAADVAKIAGRVESLPTTWQMITLVVGIVGTLLGGAFILKTALPHAP